jgi:hypothetical protein
MRTVEEMLEIQDVGDLTLEEGTALYAMAISGLQDDLSAGGIWTPRKSGASCKTFATVDRLLSCLSQATGAHYRLRFWTAQNGYAIGLPMSTILQNYTLGSILLRELIDVLSLAVEYMHEWRELHEQEKNGAHEMPLEQ